MCRVPRVRFHYTFFLFYYRLHGASTWAFLYDSCFLSGFVDYIDIAINSVFSLVYGFYCGGSSLNAVMIVV